MPHATAQLFWFAFRMSERRGRSKPETTTVSQPEDGYSGLGTVTWCDLCYEETGQKIDVAGFCHECNSFICKACLDAHKKSLASRNHMIMRDARMPKSQAEKPVKYPKCGQHIGKTKDCFCLDDSEMVCSRCIETMHPRCKTQTIQDLCKSLGSSDVNQLKSDVYNIQQAIQTTKTAVEDNITDLEINRKVMVKRVHDVRDTIVMKLEKMCSDMIEDINDICSKKVAHMSHQVLLLSDFGHSLKETDTNIDKVANVDFGPNVFIRIQDIVENANQIENEIKTMSKDIKKVELFLSLNAEVEQFLSFYKEFGVVGESLSGIDILSQVRTIEFPRMKKSQGANAKPKGKQRDADEILATPQKPLNAKTASDKEACRVEGMDISSNGLLLLGDWKNKKVKLFSTKNRLLSEVILPSRPYDVAVINDEIAIASTDEEKRYVLNISNPGQMFVQRVIPFGYCVTGMTACENNFIVIRWNEPRCVKMVDPSGQELWSTSADNNGQKLFTTPYSVATHLYKDRQVVLVTDWGKETLTVLDAKNGGFIKAVDMKGTALRGMTTDADGNIYLCYSKTSNIAVYSADLNIGRVLLSSNKLQPEPMDVSYNNHTDELFISYRGSDIIDRFKLSKNE